MMNLTRTKFLLSEKINENHYLLDAKLLIEEVNDLLGTEITSNDVDTIGGWILTKKYNVTVGNEIEEGGFIFRVKEMDGHHLRYIEVIKNNSQLEHEDQEI